MWGETILCWAIVAEGMRVRTRDCVVVASSGGYPRGLKERNATKVVFDEEMLWNLYLAIPREQELADRCWWVTWQIHQPM